MFLLRTRPFQAPRETLAALRLARNRPRLELRDVPHLPHGPARAAVAAYRLPEGPLAVSIVVRAVGGADAVAVWDWDEELSPETLRSALEAALSFAEQMGFQFDEDALAGPDPAARESALLEWEAVRPAPPVRTEAGCASSRRREAEPETMGGEALRLTKFRRRPAPPAPAPPPARRSLLGRLRLVKRTGEGEGAERTPAWLRLLGSF